MSSSINQLMDDIFNLVPIASIVLRCLQMEQPVSLELSLWYFEHGVGATCGNLCKSNVFCIHKRNEMGGVDNSIIL